MCPESQTLIYCQPRFTDTGYLHTVYFHCHNYVIIVDVAPVQIMTDFYGWIIFFFQYWKNSNKVAWHIWFWTVCLSSGVWLSFFVLSFNKVFCLLFHTFHFLGFLLQSLLLKQSHRLFQMEPLWCLLWNNNTTILKRFYSGTTINDREVSLEWTCYGYS